jgi:DNA replication ATP-dependent helicase Dna2
MSVLHSETWSLLDDLRAFVCAEFDVQRRKFAEQMALPLAERVEQGTCLRGMEFKRLDGAGRAAFSHQGNDSRLREGDRVKLSQEQAEEGISAYIYREEPDEIWLEAEGSFKLSYFENKTDGWLIDEMFIDLEKQYLDALDRLPASAIGQERILPLLAGKAEVEFDEDEYYAAHRELGTQPIRWEEAQQDAIAGCLAAQHCYLVQGPPGTGKTRVLAQVVRQLVERGERVLVTAFTHRAIDNALSATARELGDRQRVARFGAATHRRDENYDRHEKFVDSPLSGLTGGWAAGATPFALKTRLKGVEFDAIVIDEAGQMTTPLAIMAMLAGRKYLLFGDQKQLGPVVVSRSRRDAQFVGIFHALRAQEVQGTRLDITYRLNDVLTEWPSGNFYEGALKPADAAARRRLAWAADARMEAWVHAVLDPQTPLVWMPFAHEECRTTSDDEVTVAARLLQALHEGGVRQEDMAVVTPYRRQARRLRRRLETLMPGTSWRGCVIDTVERMQGQEREVIVLSFCASDPFFARIQAEFLFDPRRLNVAATRARTKLIILASDALLNAETSDPDLGEDIALLRSLSRVATRISPGSPA